MNTWTWQTLDYTKAQPGDLIQNGHEISYVEEIRAREKRGDMITPEYHVTLVGYRHEFQERGQHKGTGFSFPCFSDGTIPDADREPWAGAPYKSWQEYMDSIISNPKYIDQGVESHSRSFNVAAVIRCSGRLRVKRGTKLGYEYVDCGNEVSLDNVMTNTCEKCHSDYNSSGSKLAPRSQWGWDTGESLSDILASDWGINDRPDDSAFEGDY